MYKKKNENTYLNEYVKDFQIVVFSKNHFIDTEKFGIDTMDVYEVT